MGPARRVDGPALARCLARHYTGAALLQDLPPRARWYILFVIAAGAVTFALLLPRATFTPILPLVLLVLLSSLTSAFKVRFPIASGSNMSVSYVVDIASLILRGPHATMIVGGRQRLEPDDVPDPVAQPDLPDAVQHGGARADRRGLRPGVPAAGRVAARRHPHDRGAARRHGADLLLRQHGDDRARRGAQHAAERVARLEDRLRVERAELSPRRGRRGGRDRRHRELGLLADAAAHRRAALPDLQGVPRRASRAKRARARFSRRRTTPSSPSTRS